MAQIDLGEALRQGIRETVAADLGIDPADTERNADDPLMVTTYQTRKNGYQNWEIRHVTEPDGKVTYYQHHDRKMRGDWKPGLPDGLTKEDLVPSDASIVKPAKKRPQAKQDTTAATTSEILEAVAEWISLDEPTPSESELCDFIGNNGGRLVLETIKTGFTGYEEHDPDYPDEEGAFEFESLGWQVVHRTGAIGTPLVKHLALVESLIYSSLEHPHTKTHINLGNIEEIHLNWIQDGLQRSEHPLVELLKAWQGRPQALMPETRQTRIMPKGLLKAAPSVVYVNEPQHNSRVLPITGYVEEPESPQLALLPTADTKSGLPPVTPLLMVNAAGFGALTMGRGARLDKRILIYSLLSMPLDQRRPGGHYEWRPTLRDLVGLLWAKDAWRPNKHARALDAAFDAVTLAKVRLPDRRLWLPVVARGRPDYHDLDSHAVIQLELPELSDRGAALDFPGLLIDGRVSDPAFDLWLSLAYLWDDTKTRNGGFRIYATRPKALRNAQKFLVDAKGNVILGHPDNPLSSAGKLYWKSGNAAQRDWRHPQAVLTGEERHPHADKVPALHPEARRWLAYGLKDQHDKGNRAHERKNADELLRRLESAGRVVIERDGKLWRILEPRPKVEHPIP